MQDPTKALEIVSKEISFTPAPKEKIEDKPIEEPVTATASVTEEPITGLASVTEEPITGVASVTEEPITGVASVTEESKAE
jgi:hypothetical protein